MALKVLLTKDEYDALSESLQGEYTKAEGSDDYTLDVDDSDYKKKLGEFRGNNITMRKKLEDLEKLADQYKGVDLKKYTAAMKQIEDLEDDKLINAGDLDKVIEQRTERMRADFTGQTEALEKRAKAAEKAAKASTEHLSKVLIDSQVQTAVGEVGSLKKGAMDDVLGRARKVWFLQEGAPVPMDGDSVRYGKDGKSPMTMGEWAESLMEEAPFLFEGNKGAGAGGNDLQPPGSKLAIPGSDKDAFAANLKDIAAGKVAVDVTR